MRTMPKFNKGEGGVKARKPDKIGNSWNRI